MKYGFYSKKMEKMLGGHHVYLTEDGTEVLVTAVSKEQKNNLVWDDMEEVGQVAKFVKSTFKVDSAKYNAFKKAS